MLRDVIWKLNAKTKSEEINYEDTDSMDEINDVLLDLDDFLYPSYFSSDSSDTHLTDPPPSGDSNTPLIKNEFQNYIIGVYIFFAVLFSLGLIVIIARKVTKACCSSSEPSNYLDYEHVPRSEISNDNMGFEHHVSVSTFQTGNEAEGHNSDYDYYSDEDHETERVGDGPPPYDGPPSYIDLDHK